MYISSLYVHIINLVSDLDAIYRGINYRTSGLRPCTTGSRPRDLLLDAFAEKCLRNVRGVKVTFSPVVNQMDNYKIFSWPEQR